MIQVFCNERGAGKTKELITLANKKLTETKGDSVYIDDDIRHIRQVDRRIRFVSLEDYSILDCRDFYGLLCGIISSNFDIENIYIDGFFDSYKYNNEEMSNLFNKLKKLTSEFNINLFININNKLKEVPDFIRSYVA
ncbi:hypothetical protein KQI77_08760 [Clostridium sp. MSJ-8]|uniref:hypothetical protein n=1 Tax=Clostridium sp. MSJ-8 TaxID=2841510 RepID=UPI001C0EA49B|nr:hypothetical protein [Clostridium sp. MSJ-8]